MASTVRFYGLVRNGEHCTRHATRQEAEAAIVASKARDKQLAADGWISEKSAASCWYAIEEVKSNVW